MKINNEIADLNQSVFQLEAEKSGVLQQRNTELEKEVITGMAELQEQLERDRLVNSIAQRLRQSLSLDETLNATVREVRQLLDCDRILLYRLEPDGTGSVVQEAVVDGFPSIVGRSDRAEVFPLEYQQLYRQGRIRAIDNVKMEDKVAPCMVDFLQEFEAKAKLVVPIIQEKELWGLLIAHHYRSPRHWQALEINLLEQLATHIAIALKQALLYAQIETELKERKLAEEKVKKLTGNLEEFLSLLCVTLDSTADGILVVNHQRKIVSFNHRFVEMWRIPESVLESREHDKEVAFVKQQLKDPEGFQEKINEMYRHPWAHSHQVLELKDGRYFERYTQPQRQGEKIVGIAIDFRDITERKLAAAALQNAHDELETKVDERTAQLRQANEQLRNEKELNELKSRFISMASHEFRTPLSTILMCSDLIKCFGHKFSEEKKLEHLNKIQVQVKKMTQLLEDVLLIGKAQAKAIKFNPTEVNFLELSREVLSDICLADDEKHKFKFNCQGENSLFEMDDKLVRQIIRNLLENAVKYSPDGSTVNFEIKCKEEQATLKISDRGIGIPASEQPRLFEIFHRASNVGSIAGTGLGLAIVKEAVELHGGSITIESEEGMGTTCTVCIPRIQPRTSPPC